MVMYLDEIQIRRTFPCITEEGKLLIKALSPVSLLPILPYLNTVIKKARYNHVGGSITFFIDKKVSVCLKEYKITMRKVENMSEAYELLDRIKDLINDTYERMDELEPTLEEKKFATVMEYLRLLPRTNCKECGYPGCMAFANALYMGEETASGCPPLSVEMKEKIDLLP